MDQFLKKCKLPQLLQYDMDNFNNPITTKEIKLLIFLKLINLFIYLFLAALGLCCCARVFSSCGEQGLLFLVVHGLLTAVASLVAEHGL